MLSGRRNRYDVAFYVPWIGPLLTDVDAIATGGAETQIYLVARALADRGVRVCLLAFELPGNHVYFSLRLADRDSGFQTGDRPQMSIASQVVGVQLSDRAI